VNLSALGWYKAPELSWDEEASQGEAYYVYSFATHVAEVEVDIHTGEVRVIRVTAAHDIGRAINPQGVEGQIEGGVMQGIGYALIENMRFLQGNLQTRDLSTYTIPTSADTPRIRTLILEDPYSLGPYGAKGIGEPALIPTAPAVANAVFHAVGLRGRSLPLLPEEIYGGALRRIACRERFGEVKPGD
jgi:CO/xanthine dehydrogenase Mo-binding subunit